LSTYRFTINVKRIVIYNKAAKSNCNRKNFDDEFCRKFWSHNCCKL